MRLTPRGEEVAEVVAILESGNYDGPEDMAKDIIKQVADFLWFREWYVLSVHKGANFGPFASQAEAATYGHKYAGALVPKDPELWGVATVRGLGGTVEERAAGGFGYCVTKDCGHAVWMHSMVGAARGKCVLALCNCGRYEAAKPRPRTTRKKAAP